MKPLPLLIVSLTALLPVATKANTIIPPILSSPEELTKPLPSDGWKLFGYCYYDWANWKLHPGGARTTAADCGTSMRWIVAVSCKRQMVIRKYGNSKWDTWVEPSPRHGEPEMVAALCGTLPLDAE